MKVVVVFGTRPEAIKLAPVINELRKRIEDAEVRVVATGQHRALLDQALDVFGIQPDYDLDVMRPRQTLPDMTCRLLSTIETVLAKEQADLVLVQGDTTTVFVSSLAAFYQRIPVAHVEAGLRSYNRYDPFPEEINRRLTTALSTLHFAPTHLARRNLLKEGVPRSRIFVTGNTIVDALHHILASEGFQRTGMPVSLDPDRRVVLVTLHRREAWGLRLEGMCEALRKLVEVYNDIEIVFPVHLNPQIREAAFRILGGLPRVWLVDPLNYFSFLAVLSRSYLVLTDSGGVQEEAPVFGKPVLVLRGTTERPEAVQAGVARVVGTSEEAILRAMKELLGNSRTYSEMARCVSPFGDGHAAARIAEIICDQEKCGLG